MSKEEDSKSEYIEQDEKEGIKDPFEQSSLMPEEEQDSTIKVVAQPAEERQYENISRRSEEEEG